MSVAWLLEETKADAAVPRGPLFVADDENWRATVERISPAPGLHVFLNDIEARRDFRVEPMSLPLKEYVTSQVTLAGSVEFDFAGGLRTRTSPDSAVLYRPVSRAPVFVFAAATRYRSVGYTLDLGRVEPAELGKAGDIDHDPDPFAVRGKRRTAEGHGGLPQV